MTDYIFSSGEHMLDHSGRPVAGYTLRGDAVYERARIHGALLRLKEWDFYQISDERYCLQLVIGHVSYAGNCNIAFFDHRSGERIFERGSVSPLPLRSMRLPQSAHADSILSFSRDGIELAFETSCEQRKLTARCGSFSAEVELNPAVEKSILVCTPFSNKREFYVNEKINLLSARVAVQRNGREYAFDPDHTFSLLDWGRGVWPVSHEWYWSSASTLFNGAPFGFNLGCGFGDESRKRGTENVIYLGNQAYKLGAVRITHESDPMLPWHLVSEDGRFSAVLTPRYDRDTITKLFFVNNRCHQMFGSFEGIFRPENGTAYPFSGISGFAEHAVNHW
ncbi:MAG: DUF2804 domain-containing protein [Eubacteriales bacterium]|nr:DUF2804 domain-containing protein [Eubacteriales bacterium]